MLVDIILGFLIFLALALYIYGVAYACKISLSKEGNGYSFPPFLANVITIIGGVLSTNLGAVIGISIITPPGTALNLTSFWSPFRIFTNPDPEAFQIIACYVYIFSLVAALVVWLIRKFEPDPTKIVPILPEMTKTLLGIAVGALVMALSLENASN